MRTLSLLLAMIFALPSMLCAGEAEIAVLRVRGAITPVTAAYLTGNLTAAAARGDRLVLVEMDTPGGLDTAMRDVVQGILASPVAVAVHIAPAGARAASAGAVIALSADVVAMAGGTNIGAAHPVSLGSAKPDNVMEAKVLNDAAAYVEGIAAKRGRNAEVARRMVRESISMTAETALKEKVIDLIAADRQELLAKLDGWKVQRGGTESVLRLHGAKVVLHEMGTRDSILQTLSSPDIAYLLMLLGIMGIFFELAHPGAILPGVVGGIALFLSLFALQTLPVNYAGVALILLAIVLFAAEVKVASYGMLAVGGVVAMVLGSLMLFPSSEPALRLSRFTIAGTVAATFLFFTVVVTKVVQAHREKPITGVEGMLGGTGVAESDIAPRGKVFFRGEYWNAESAEPIAKGDKVDVVAVNGLQLIVKKHVEQPL